MPPASAPPQDFLARLEMLAIADLRPHSRNDGAHPPDEIAHLRQSIREHDIYRNIVVAQDGTTLAGHGVILAAQAEGKTHVPGYRMPYGPDDPRALKLLVGDNHMARLREQDDPALAALLAEIAVDGAEALLGTGFDAASMQALLDSVGAGNGEAGIGAGYDVEPEIDRAEELREQWGVAVGQLWELGPHRVCCGDCTDKAVIERLLGAVVPSMLLNDPPYGLALETDWTETTGRSNRFTILNGKPRTHRAHRPIHGDNVPFDRRIVPLEAPEEFWFGADYYVDTLPTFGKEGSWFVWDKRQEGSVDTMWGSAFELCWSKAPHRREVMRIVWAGVLGHNRHDDGPQKFHPTQKPVALYTWLLDRFSEEGAHIFDGFLGSGTTLIACHNLGRVCRGVELDAAYTAVCLQRWADLTGQMPVLLA